MAALNYGHPPQPPPVFKTTPEAISADTKKMIEQDKKVLDKLVAEVTPENATYNNVFGPFLDSQNELSGVGWVLGFHANVSPDKSVRDASTASEAAQDDYNIDAKLREDVFKLVDAVYQKIDSQNLDEEAKRIVTKERQKYINNGLLLPAGPERDHFTSLQKRMSQLAIEANKNLNEENGGIFFTPEELEGVPKDDIDISTLEKGTGENEGKVKVTFKYNHSLPLLKYAVNEKTRREYVIAESNKANVNEPLFNELIQLRDESARLLGYKNHAEFRISQKMAKTPERVFGLLSDVRTKLAGRAKEEVAHLLEYKKKDCEERGAPFDGNFYSWDTAFYSRLMKVKEYSVDEIAVSQYFPIESTFKGMLKIFEEILGFAFHELTPEERTKLSATGKGEDVAWHEDALIYSVFDDEAAGSGFRGYLYLDFHPRDGKYTHNACFDLHSRYIKSDGGISYTSTALVCNFSKPTAAKPALLKHLEVVTLFHELGHGIHQLAGNARNTYLQGTSTAWDFVEAPSQMLENWCWTPSVLQSLSKHWETGEKIPDDLLNKLMGTKHMNRAIHALYQVQIGTFDMTVHSLGSPEAAKSVNAGHLWNQIRRDIMVGIKGPEDLGLGKDWGKKHLTVGHFIGGYDAGYYGYLFSEVFSLDMFHTKFKANPMNKEEGRRYRELVLSRGGSRDELTFLTEFLGREPNTDAFYKELGIE